MSFGAGDKVTWAAPLPGEPAWKQEQRKRWEAEFGPPPYTVKHTSPFRPGEVLVYTKELYDTYRSYRLLYFGSPWTAPPGTKFGKWVRVRSSKGLIQSWFDKETGEKS